MPQPQTVPSVLRARLKCQPAETPATPAKPGTWTAAVTGVGERSPVPNSPWLLSPQSQTVPSLRAARLWEYPPATDAMTPFKPLTAPGVETPADTPPFPSCPASLTPHAQTV